MGKIFLVAKREYLENVRTKGFWIGIMLVPILYTGMFLGPAWIEKSKPAKKFAVIDQSGWLLEKVEERMLVEDLSRIFLEVGEAHREDRPMPGLPDYLASLGKSFAETDPYKLSMMAAATAFPTEAGATADLPAELSENRGALLTWWKKLSPKETKTLFKSTTRNDFVLLSNLDADPEKLNNMVLTEELFAYFVIGADPVTDSQGCKYISTNLTDDDLQSWFGRYTTAVVRDQRLQKENIDASVAGWIQSPLSFEGRKLSASGEEREVSLQDKVRQWAPAAFVYLLWISVFTISNMLMTNTIEEKSNRLIEVLLSSMSPIQLMAGKMTGIAWTGLTMVGTWILCVIAGTAFLPGMLGLTLPFDMGAILSDPAFTLSFGIYFVLGYLLYGSILVGLGSVFNSLKEAQSLMGPVMMLLFIPLILMVPISQDPNGLLAKICSYIPPLTPFTMMNRAAAPPTTLEYIATSVLLLASVLFSLWASAKIFRIGILLTGKPPKIREMVRWIKAPVGLAPEHKEA
ncbi:MAG: ABC transporter permease [Acidobacteriota bacterium]|nr:ABC transporter permease [Acidobacteriota bacterium]